MSNSRILGTCRRSAYLAFQKRRSSTAAGSMGPAIGVAKDSGLGGKIPAGARDGGEGTSPEVAERQKRFEER